MKILGISAFYHDSAAALVTDGNIVAAAQEERFTRIKHDASFPQNAIEFCLKQGGSTGGQVDFVVFYDKPLLKFERILETYLAFAPRGLSSFKAALPLWIKEKLQLRTLIPERLSGLLPGMDWSSQLLFSEHHLSHAASAFFPSPFDEAAILTLDGVGEWTTTSLCTGVGSRIDIHKEIVFPHSLGLLYSAFTYYTGFRVNSGEYKLMGLAPYGEPKYVKTILDHLIDLKPDGSFRLNMTYFDYCTALKMTNSRFDELFEGPPRKSDEPLTRKQMDLAASIQAVTDEAILRLTRSIANETGMKNLCLAGGVALNCVTNGKLLRDGTFDALWIQPAAGDAGAALGAALVAYYHHTNGKRAPFMQGGRDAMQGSFLGPAFALGEIEARLESLGARYQVLNETQLLEKCVEELCAGKALGWFQGRMEFGPRALGARSILADPRSPGMQSTLNNKVKFRESFRPFAPSVLREDVSEWFDLNVDAPYMLITAEVLSKHRRDLTPEEEALTGVAKLQANRSVIPAVTHVDYSARVQTVHKDTNPKYYDLLSAFHDKTGCPILVNTSFNVRGEPIVCSPEDAFRCFMSTEIEALAIGDCFLLKSEQDAGLLAQYRKVKTAFAPD